MSISAIDEDVLDHLRSQESRPLDVRELVIEADNPCWLWLMRYGAAIRDRNAGIGYQVADRVITLSTSDGRIELGLAIGRHRLLWRDSIFEVTVEKNDSEERARVHLPDAETCAAFEDFLRHGRARSRRKGGSDSDKIRVKVINGTTWKEVSSYPKRPPESVVTGDSTVEDLLKDMRHFIQSEDDYIKYGRPFKRNVLIIGAPGSGKSSIVTVLASELDLDVCFVSVNSNMDEKNLGAAIGNLTSNSMLVIEDVDVLCTSAIGSSQAQNSLSVLTNVLDGALHKHKLITVLTSANPEALEGVLVRHGRVDYTCRLPPLGKKQITAMVKRVFPDDYKALTARVCEEVDRLGSTTATVLAQFLFRHRNDTPGDLNTAELTEGTHTKHIQDGRRETPENFYM